MLVMLNSNSHTSLDDRGKGRIEMCARVIIEFVRSLRFYLSRMNDR